MTKTIARQVAELPIGTTFTFEGMPGLRVKLLDTVLDGRTGRVFSIDVYEQVGGRWGELVILSDRPQSDFVTAKEAARIDWGLPK